MLWFVVLVVKLIREAIPSIGFSLAGAVYAYFSPVVKIKGNTSFNNNSAVDDGGEK